MAMSSSAPLGEVPWFFSREEFRLLDDFEPEEDFVGLFKKGPQFARKLRP